MTKEEFKKRKEDNLRAYYAAKEMYERIDIEVKRHISDESFVRLDYPVTTSKKY
jgi:hypothetical protein